MILIHAGAFLLSLVMKKVWCSGLSEIIWWILQGQIFMLTEYNTDIRGISCSFFPMFWMLWWSLQSLPTTASNHWHIFQITAFCCPGIYITHLSSGWFDFVPEKPQSSLFFENKGTGNNPHEKKKKMHAWFVPTIRHM